MLDICTCICLYTYCICVHIYIHISSVQFSHSVMSDSLRQHESEHARPPYPSPTPGVHSDSCPSSQWWHPAISYSVIPFSCPQSLPASESFPMSQLFAWGGQITGVSALTSVLPMNAQDWFLWGLTGLASFQSKRLSRVFYSTTTWKYQFFGTQPSYGPALTSVHDYWKNHSFGISKHLVSPSASGKMSIYLE